MKAMANLSHLSSYINLENTGINLLMLQKPQILSNHEIIEPFRLYRTVKTEPNPALSHIPKCHTVQCCQYKWKCVCHKPFYSHIITKFNMKYEFCPNTGKKKLEIYIQIQLLQ